MPMYVRESSLLLGPDRDSEFKISEFIRRIGENHLDKQSAPSNILNPAFHETKVELNHTQIRDIVIRVTLSGLEQQQLIFSLYRYLSDKKKATLLEEFLIQSTEVEIISRCIRSIPAIQSGVNRDRLFQMVLKGIKKGLNSTSSDERSAYLKLAADIPLSIRRKVLRYIFKSSYLYQEIQFKIISIFSHFTDDEKIGIAKRIVTMRDPDEKIIHEVSEWITSMAPANRQKLLVVLLKYAPFDEVAPGLVDKIQYIPAEFRNDQLLRLSIRAINPIFFIENRELRKLAVSMISRFPPSYRFKLVMTCLDSEHLDVRLSSLRNVITLPEPHRYRILKKSLEKSKSHDQDRLLLLRSFQLSGLLIPVHKKEFIDTGAKLVRESLESIIRNPYHYRAIQIIPSLPFISDVELKNAILDLAEKALESIFKSNRREGHILGLRMIEWMYSKGRVRVLKLALQSEYVEVISRVRHVMSFLVPDESDEILPFFIESIVLHQLEAEIKKYNLDKIRTELQKISVVRPLELIAELSEFRFFSASELYRYLEKSMRDAQIIDDRILESLKIKIRSDNEKILTIKNVLFPFAEIINTLSADDKRILYRIALLRLKRKEKGFSADLSIILNDILKQKISLKKDGENLRKFIRDERLQSYDFSIFNEYRKLENQKQDEYIEIIRDIYVSILSGADYSNLRKEIKKTDISSSVNEDFIFAILLQLLPIDSAHLSREEARKIFLRSLDHEDEIRYDLQNILPDAIDKSSGHGIRISHASYGLKRSQSKPFHYYKITEFLSPFQRGTQIDDPGDLRNLLNTLTREDFKEFVIHYLYFHLRDRIQDIHKKFQSPFSRYEALTSLSDLLGDTFNEILRSGINRARGMYKNYELIELLRVIQQRLGITLPLVKYIGRMKPGTIYKLIKRSYIDYERTVGSFFAENIMLVESNDSGEMSWSRFLKFLRNEQNGHFFDPMLAAEIERLMLKMDREQNKYEVSEIQKLRNPDPFRVLFDEMDEYLWSGLRRELQTAIDSYDVVEKIKESDILYQTGKSSWLSIFGGLADLCIARDHKLFARDNFTLISMIQDGRYVGFHLVHIVKEEEKLFLVLAGCEPSNQFSSRHAPEKIYNEAVDVLVEIGSRVQADYLVQIADENAYSNRDKIKKYILRNVLPEKKFGQFKKPLYLGSFGSSTFRSRDYYVLHDFHDSVTK